MCPVFLRPSTIPSANLDPLPCHTTHPWPSNKLLKPQNAAKSGKRGKQMRPWWTSMREHQRMPRTMAQSSLAQATALPRHSSLSSIPAHPTCGTFGPVQHFRGNVTINDAKYLPPLGFPAQAVESQKDASTPSSNMTRAASRLAPIRPSSTVPARPKVPTGSTM